MPAKRAQECRGRSTATAPFREKKKKKAVTTRIFDGARPCRAWEGLGVKLSKREKQAACTENLMPVRLCDVELGAGAGGGGCG